MCQILGEGWNPMFGPATETQCRQWFADYTRQGDWGGWKWFALVEIETEETLESWENEESEE